MTRVRASHARHSARKTTKRVRLLGLGIPIANRPDPLRVAEECAMIDVISRGRLDMGFIKGVPYEIVPSNARPVRIMDRFWEAHDLILKAMTTHDGPFSWEGEHFQYRSVNIWPRPVAAAASAGLGQPQQPRQRRAQWASAVTSRHRDDRLPRQNRVRRISQGMA